MRLINSDIIIIIIIIIIFIVRPHAKDLNATSVAPVTRFGTSV